MALFRMKSRDNQQQMRVFGYELAADPLTRIRP
jgi:hypothetical protein